MLPPFTKKPPGCAFQHVNSTDKPSRAARTAQVMPPGVAPMIAISYLFVACVKMSSPSIYPRGSRAAHLSADAGVFIHALYLGLQLRPGP